MRERLYVPASVAGEAPASVEWPVGPEQVKAVRQAERVDPVEREAMPLEVSGVAADPLGGQVQVSTEDHVACPLDAVEERCQVAELLVDCCHGVAVVDDAVDGYQGEAPRAEGRLGHG